MERPPIREAQWNGADDQALGDLLELRRLWAEGARTLLRLGLTADDLEVRARL